MDKIIKNTLEKITNEGFNAYLVGGFVRDYLLGIKSLDIDICTNALPKDLHKIFPVNNNSNEYGGFNLQIKKYNIDITTFRKELKYEGRKPTEIVYINSLEEDIKRRDFTINAICMDKNEKIIDLVDGVNDLNNHQIKMLGDISEKLQEDPLRILRAIRFATVLNFEIDSDLDKKIQEYYQLVGTLSKSRIKGELNKILLHKNFLKGLELLKKYQILDLLKISYDNDMTYVSDLSGMWAQLEFSTDFAFTKQEIRNIINIRRIVRIGHIDNHSLFNYGLYTNLVAADILNFDKKVVNKLAKNIPIRKNSDLDITSEEIMTILNIEPSKKLRMVTEELIDLVLDNKLKNKNSEIKKYLKER